jgi:hypothetical protein
LAGRLAPLRFETAPTATGETEIRAAAHWVRDVSFPWEDRVFHAESGQPLRVFTSRRYTPEGFTTRLERAGFSISDFWISPCRQEGLWQAALAG